MIGYLDKAIRQLVLIMPKVIGYVQTFKVKDGDKNKKNKMMYLPVNDEKVSEKYKSIWTKIEDLKNTEFNALTFYDY